MPFHIVLVEPEIPANTGNISRTCAATGTILHLVRPLGFSTDDRELKRAGLDYWHSVHIEYHDSLQELLDMYPEGRFFFATTKASKGYSTIEYQDGDFLVFGKETKGLPQHVIDQHPDTLIKIPISHAAVRSLNLSNSVAIVLYEALRQASFPGLK